MPIEVRREQVLDAALRLIARDGYGAVTMEAVAREANIAKPVVYNAYPGRGQLLYALLDREERKALATLAAALPLDAGPDSTRALHDWLRRLAEAVAANPEPWRLMLRPAGETPIEVRERVERGRDLALTQIRSLLPSLLAGNAALAGLDEELAAHSVLAVCEQCARLLVADPDRYPPDRLVSYAEKLLGALA
jgi:AcrR family transcriptional regulator